MVLSIEILFVILGWILGVSNFFIIAYYKERRTKKFASKAILLEVEANQNRIQTHIKNGEDVLNELNENDADFEIVDVNFDRTIYSALADKIGLLDSKIQDSVVQYYTKIPLVEDEVRACNKKYSSYHSQRVRKIRKSALERSIKNAIEANNIGEEVLNVKQKNTG